MHNSITKTGKTIKATKNNIFNIETKELGVWESVETADNAREAYHKASALTKQLREENIRIDTPEGEIL